jgi:hypothetical protein
MKLLIGLLEVTPGNVSVDLGGRDVLVTQHLLDVTEVGTILEKVGCKAVADAMGGDFDREVGAPTVPVDQALHAPDG